MPKSKYDNDVSEFTRWLMGLITPETAVDNPDDKTPGWARREIERFPEEVKSGWCDEDDWVSSDGFYHAMTPEMKKLRDDYNKKGSTVASANTKTKILDGEHIKLNADKNDRAIHVPQGETYKGVMNTLEAARADQMKVIHFTRTYDYRPMDGGFAAYNVLKRIFGVAISKPYTVPGPMGPVTIEPEIVTVKTGPKKSVSVPWGGLALPGMENTLVKLQANKTKNGPVFSIEVDAPKYQKPEVDRILDLIEEELKANSIYRGKAMVGAFELEFLDLSKFDAKKIVFSDYVTEALDAALWGTLRNSDTLVKAGLPLKRSILLYGPFGTGKSSIGAITAQVAEQNSWTFLQARTGEDDVADVLRTAMLYQPAVVFVEDLGEQASALNSSDKISKLLETFDGITSKDSKVVMVMTTNHVENIHKGMLRPGRIDLALEIAGLDRNGTERLLKAVVDPRRLASDVDYDALYEHMRSWEPAWVRAAADRAQLWAINRSGGLNFKLNTSDLMNAAISLESQLELLRKAAEGATLPTLDTAMREVFEGALHGVAYVDDDGDSVGTYLSVSDDVRLELKR